jgi:DNA polymerase-3 subunit alpha
VQQIGKDLAGYTLAEADLLRRAMGKKIKAEMDAQRDVFVKGCVKNRIEEELASTIFDLVAKFASYGFNKSHAAAYALLAYQTAYLKANHPVEFYAAAMTLDMANQDKLGLYRSEMAERGIKLYPPDVNASAVRFAVEDGSEGTGVRYALAAIKGVGAHAMAALVAEREAAGPFTDLFDLCCRLGPKALNKRLLEGLIKAGAMDRFTANRRQQAAALEKALRWAAACAEEAASSQVSLFGGSGSEPVRPPVPVMEAADDWPAMERLGLELEAVGFYMSAHPLDGYKSALERLRVVPAGRLRNALGSGETTRVIVAGVVTGRQERTTERSRFAFAQLSDPTGTFEITIFGDLLAQIRDLLSGHEPLKIEADGRLEGDAIKLTAQKIERLDDIADTGRDEIEIRLASPLIAQRLKPFLGEGKGARVRLVVPTGEAEEAILALPPAFTLRHAALLDVERMEGVLGVREVMGR